jgi:hypothetical protein
LGFIGQIRQLEVVFMIMVKGTILLNFSRDDETLFEIAPKKCKLVKTLGMIKSCPFKFSKPKP